MDPPPAPIHQAVMDGNLDEVKTLMGENHALLEARTQEVIRINLLYQVPGVTPLIIASVAGHEEMVEWLLD